jgi:hypothetical protein
MGKQQLCVRARDWLHDLQVSNARLPHLPSLSHRPNCDDLLVDGEDVYDPVVHNGQGTYGLPLATLYSLNFAASRTAHH